MIAQTTQNISINGFPNQVVKGNIGFVFGLTVAGNILTIGPGGCSTAAGTTTFVTTNAVVIIVGGNDTGTISIGCSPIGVETAYLGAGFTASNYSCSTVTCVTSAIPAGTVITGTVGISNGAMAASSVVSLPVVAPPGAVSGGVTSIATACGITGGPITATGTVTGSEVENAQTGASYTVIAVDCGKLVSFSNAGAIAVTLTSPVTLNSGWYADIINLGVGTVTLTPSSGTINGNAIQTLTTGQGGRLESNGTNFRMILGGGTGTTSGGGSFVATPTNVSANALQAGTVTGWTTPATLAVFTSSLTNNNSSTTVTITVTGTTSCLSSCTYTILRNGGAGPLVNQIQPNGETLILNVAGSTAWIANDPYTCDTTMTCPFGTYPWTIGLNSAALLPLSYTWTGYHNFNGGFVRFPESVVGSLPSATANAGKEFIVTDGATSTDCTTGGGIIVVNMCRSDGTTWAYIGGGGGTAFNPLDVTTSFWIDTWSGFNNVASTAWDCMAATNSYTGGSGRWRGNFSAATALCNWVYADSAHGPALQLVTNATTGFTTILGSFHQPGSTANWTAENILKTDSSSTGVSTLDGLSFANYASGSVACAQVYTSDNCIAISYQPAVSANWILSACNGATCNYTDTTVAYANSTWFLFKLSSTTVGTILAQVNSGPVVSLATSIPTVTLSFSPINVLTISTSRTFLVNWSAWYRTGMTRP